MMNAFAAVDPFAPLPGGGEAFQGRPDEPADDWDPLPVPGGAPEPPDRHGKLGAVSQRWAYRQADGSVAGYICRFDTAEGKELRPQRYGRLRSRVGWHWKGWPGDRARPLYRLPELLADPEASVLLTEGEKAADAAAALIGPPYLTVASMNGAQSPQNTDWSPLAGRDLVIWPDNDAPGRAFATEAAKLALAAGAASVRVVDVPEDLPEGWDLADPVPYGVELDLEDLLTTAPAFDPDGEEQGTFRVQYRRAGKLMPGLYYMTSKEDPETGENVPSWHWFASRLDVLAYSRDGDSREWGRYLAVHDNDGKIHHVAMPMAAMAGDGAEYRRELLRHGFIIAPGKTAREQLDVYLSMWRPRRRVRCVPQVGWHGPRFVLPDRTFGPGGETVVLQASRPAKFITEGSLAGWQEHVATPAADNSRLAFALSTSFAGPLLHLTGQESGGFHFRGGSSIGKTSSLHAARSTWGCVLGSWRTTDNAAEATVAGASDTLLLLDEVSQADNRVVDTMAYMLGNGTGKNRATRTGGTRDVATWRILFLSTGELSLADKIAEAGKRARAGQSVRVIDIPADAGQGLGLFDTLHGFASGAALADHLCRSGEAHSGHAARAFLEQISGGPAATAEVVREYMSIWLATNLPKDADGQVGRVAARFALVAAAGELATALEILPWPEGEASAAAARCFRDWLATRGGNGPEEITEGLRQVRKFLEMHGSSRFEAAWESRTLFPQEKAGVDKTINRAGFRKLEANRWEFYILPEAWRTEVCAGFDARAIAKAMVSKSWMKQGEDSHPSLSVRVPGLERIRLYCITSDFLAGNES